MKKLIKRILKESIEEIEKERVLKLIEKKGILKTLNFLNMDIFELSNILDRPVKEMMKEYNLFETIFTDEEFQNSLIETVVWMGERKKIFEERLKRYSKKELVNYLIELTIDDFNSQLNSNTGDWKIPNTPELLYLRYGDWLINNDIFKTFYAPYEKTGKESIEEIFKIK